MVRQLEKDWETALAERQRLSEDYDRFTATRPRVLTAAEREQIRLLAADIPAVWDAPTTTTADRTNLIRHLVEQVRIAVAGISEKVGVDIAWVGGHRTQGQVVRPVATLAQLSYYPQLRERARELTGAGMTTAQIAGQLNAEGFRPPKNPTKIFTPNAVSDRSALWASRALAFPRSGPARPGPSTSGGCATSPSTWECQKSLSTCGCGAAGRLATCTRSPGTGSCAPTRPKSNASARCT